MYVHRLRSGIGAMLASLGGLDVLVFTAGVGEHSPEIRQAACEAFEFLGLKIDPQKNQQQPIDQDIATPDSAVRSISNSYSRRLGDRSTMLVSYELARPLDAIHLKALYL